MNTRIKLAFIRSLDKKPGFALPLALMIGLVILTIGIGMIGRTQGDQSRVTTQKIKADGLSVAEMAVTQVRQLIDENRLLSMYDSTYWSNSEVQTLLGVAIDARQANSCNNSNSDSSSTSTTESTSILSNISSIAGANWTNLPNNRSYRLVNYDYSGDPEGEITGVKGDITKAYATLDGRAGADQGLAQSRLEVEIPVISQRDPIFENNNSIPGLWLAEGTTDDLTNPVGNDGRYTGGANFKSNVVMSDRCSYPERQQDQQQAITTFITENRITGGYNARFVTEKFPELPAIPTNLPTDQQNLSLTSDMTFPRSTDVPINLKQTIGYQDPNNSANNVASQNDVEVYEYIVTNINLSGGRNITITPGKKVIFYVQGDVSSTSNGSIKHDCSLAETGVTCEPTNFQIFAYNTSNSNNPQICLKGNSRLDAFIFAPDYLIGKTGTGEYYGGIWGKSWGKIANCGSNTSVTAVVQKGQWSSLYNDLKPADPLPKIGQVRNWREVPIN
jgi:Tfp pilus assembly protein PilX